MSGYDDIGLVSIITPTYNCAAFISDSIKSVCSQSFSNWELIIIDDCSSDNTEEVVKPYLEQDKRIRFIRNDRNYGAAISRNRGLREAKGRWIAFLDGDDLWSPNKLELQLQFMVSNGVFFSYTCYSEMDSEGNDRGVFVSGPKHITKFGMYAFCWLGCLTVMYDREKIGLIQIEDIKKNNDYAMWLKACKKADCFLLDECLAKYRRGRVGSVSSHGIMTMIGWHYKLWHEAEGKSLVSSLWWTGVNLICGFYKKLKYVNKGVVK